MARPRAELETSSTENSMDTVSRAKYDNTMNPLEMYYDFSGNKGLAIIFNHRNFGDNDALNTQHDAELFKACFEKYNFDVKSYEDQRVDQIKSILTKIADKESSKPSCLIIAVSSHGNETGISARDTTYPRSILWETFAGKLVGVPKLFFIDCCRGVKSDKGVEVADSARKNFVYKLPKMADILIAYSTYEGYESYDFPDGSYFIKTLCNEIDNKYENWDLLQILTFVNKKIAVALNVSFGKDEDLKMMPQVVTMLTKLLKFQKNHKYYIQSRPKMTDL